MVAPLVGALLTAGTTAYQADRARSAERSQREGLQRGIRALEGGQAGFEQSVAPFLGFGQQAINPLSQLLGFSPAQTSYGPQQAVNDGFSYDFTPQEQTNRLNLAADSISNRFGSGGLFGELSDKFRSQAGQIAEQAPQVTQQAPLDATQNLQTDLLPAQQPAMQEEINPLVSFLRQEGFEDIQESAAARGRLGAGGTLQDLERFSQNLASTYAPSLQQQRFNQLFSAVQLGGNLASQQGTARLGTGQGIANIQAGLGANAAQGAVEQGNIISGGIGNLAGGLGQLFGGSRPQLMGSTAPITGGAAPNPNSLPLFQGAF